MKKIRFLSKSSKIFLINLLVIVVLSIMNIKLKQYGHFLLWNISQVMYHVCVVLTFILLIENSISEKDGKVAKIIKLLLYCPFLMILLAVVSYMVIPLTVEQSVKFKSPEKVIKKEIVLRKLENISEELIRRKNIIWVSSDIEKGDFLEFTIRYPDGDYVFQGADLSKNINNLQSVQAVKTDSVDYFGNTPINSDVNKSLNTNDYLFCKETGIIIREAGFDQVEYSPKDNIVQFQIDLPIGFDHNRFYTYYFCRDGNIPKEYKYSKKLNANWYFRNAGY